MSRERELLREALERAPFGRKNYGHFDWKRRVDALLAQPETDWEQRCHECEALMAELKPETGERVWMYLWERAGKIISSPPFECEELCRREAMANKPAGPGYMLRIESAPVGEWVLDD